MLHETWQWSTANSAADVHALLLQSDRRSCAEAGIALPRRNLSRTVELVEAGAVLSLTIDGHLAAAITLTHYAPFDTSEVPFVDDGPVLYMQRLSVSDEAVKKFGAIPGISTVRRAIETAASQGAVVLRSEVNPDVRGVAEMLCALGFRRIAESKAADDTVKLYLEFALQTGR